MSTLVYEESGSGSPVIFLHGNGGTGADFALQMNYFSKSHRVITVDTRGHGKSPRGTAPLSFPQFAEDLREFMDELNLESANIVGFSDGANTAILFAAENPRRVRKLVLCGACITPKAVKRSIQIPIEIGYRIASLLPGGKENAEILGLMVKDFGITEEHLQRIQAETLVLAGTKDMITVRHTRMIAERIPRAKLQFIEGDHFLPMKSSEAFNKTVDAFLKEE